MSILYRHVNENTVHVNRRGHIINNISIHFYLHCPIIEKVGGGFVEVIATSGDSHLGGDDFDSVIANWIIEQFGATFRNSSSSSSSSSSSNTIFDSKSAIKAVRANPAAMSRVTEAAELAKIALSTHKVS